MLGMGYDKCPDCLSYISARYNGLIKENNQEGLNWFSKAFLKMWLHFLQDPL